MLCLYKKRIVQMPALSLLFGTNLTEPESGATTGGGSDILDNPTATTTDGTIPEWTANKKLKTSGLLSRTSITTLDNPAATTIDGNIPEWTANKQLKTSSLLNRSSLTTMATAAVGPQKIIVSENNTKALKATAASVDTSNNITAVDFKSSSGNFVNSSDSKGIQVGTGPTAPITLTGTDYTTNKANQLLRIDDTTGKLKATGTTFTVTADGKLVCDEVKSTGGKFLHGAKGIEISTVGGDQGIITFTGQRYGGKVGQVLQLETKTGEIKPTATVTDHIADTNIHAAKIERDTNNNGNNYLYRTGSTFPALTNYPNVIIGEDAGLSATSPASSVFIGDESARGTTGGQYNIAIGHQNYVGNGNSCVTLGPLSGCNGGTGDSNTCIGEQSGSLGTITNGKGGQYNTFLGAQNGGDWSKSQQIAIGYKALCTENKECCIGDNQLVRIRNGGNGVCDLGKSDYRFKDAHLSGTVNCKDLVMSATTTTPTTGLSVKSDGVLNYNYNGDNYLVAGPGVGGGGGGGGLTESWTGITTVGPGVNAASATTAGVSCSYYFHKVGYKVTLAIKLNGIISWTGAVNNANAIGIAGLDWTNNTAIGIAGLPKDSVVDLPSMYPLPNTAGVNETYNVYCRITQTPGDIFQTGNSNVCFRRAANGSFAIASTLSWTFVDAYQHFTYLSANNTPFANSTPP